MKILYISPEHVSGTLSLFKAEHERRGDLCRFVTFWHSHWDFPDDICLDLPFMPDQPWVRGLRHAVKSVRGGEAPAQPQNGIPYWSPTQAERYLFSVRDRLLWPRISTAIRKHQLDSFDIIHLDGGLDFTRDARFIRRASLAGKRIACFYHGSDMRNRGVIQEVDDVVQLRLTSEWDLIEFDSRLHYLYLPFDTTAYPERPYRFHSPIRICHASRNPYKGTAFVERAVSELARRYSVELVLLRDLSHAEALRRKQECDIFVDQLTNEGGWGYGMSSVEAFAMGLPVVSNIPGPMASKLGDHPFVHATSDDVAPVLERLIADEASCARLAAAGREWVRGRHDVRVVVNQLYAHYRTLGWIGNN
jgi:hypothetical protein